MSNVYVSIPVFYTGSEGYFECHYLGGGNTLILPERKTNEYLFIALYEDSDSKEVRSQKLSEGMKNAHLLIQEKLEEEYGDLWREMASYSFGNLEFATEAEPTEEELEYYAS